MSALRAGGSCARAGLCGADAGSQVTGLMASGTEQEGLGGEREGEEAAGSDTAMPMGGEGWEVGREPAAG